MTKKYLKCTSGKFFQIDAHLTTLSTNQVIASTNHSMSFNLKIFSSLLHSPELEFPDRVLVSIVSVIFDLPIDNLVCESQGSTNQSRQSS